jgi:hypothetical protein
VSDSRVLIAIAVGAAFAGWLIVRFIDSGGESADTRVVAVEQARTEDVEPEESAGEPPAVEPEAPRADAAADASTGDEDPEVIAQELALIASTLSKDKFMHNRAFPDDATILEMPSVVTYLRSVDFWQPVFTNGAREMR